ncbi:MAG: C40 family peptidase [Actinomycetaceae bacterium]|nr:C40 family peptidase [Actinomycetaceae bacterium]MDY5854719.1 C40 family peptidase [Arcanobacterium sp.]
MGKHSIVKTAQGIAAKPGAKACAVATVAGAFFGVGSSMAVAAPEAENAVHHANKVVAAKVDLAKGLSDSKNSKDAAQKTNQTGWAFTVAEASVKPAPVVERRDEVSSPAAPADHSGEARLRQYVPPADSSLGSEIVALARTGIGVPYVWAGSTPAGWDCSGFVMWVLGNLGISVPHGADPIARMFTSIPASEAQPGDLVWWPGRHIAIYAGNGQIIGAQDYGIGTIETSLYGSYEFVRVS